MNTKVRGWFISGTDTEVGKTTIAEALLRAAASVAANYADVDPYAFAPAIAPHVAAAK